MPWRGPDGWVKDVAVTQLGPGNTWVWASDGSLWVHWNFVIHVPHEINTHFFTTFWLLKGKSWSPCTRQSMELTAWLASVTSLLPNRALLIARYFDPIVTAQQWDMFRPIVVCAFWLIPSLKWIFYKRYFSQTKWSMLMLVDCIHKILNKGYMQSNLLRFTFHLQFFNFIARVWLNCFACVLFIYFYHINCFSRN